MSNSNSSSNGEQDGGAGSNQEPQQLASAPLNPDNSPVGQSSSGSIPSAVAQIEQQGHSGQPPVVHVPGGNTGTAHSNPNQVQASASSVLNLNQTETMAPELFNRLPDPLFLEAQQRSQNDIETLMSLNNQNNNRWTNESRENYAVQSEILQIIGLRRRMTERQLFQSISLQQGHVPPCFVQHQISYTYSPNIIPQQQGGPTGMSSTTPITQPQPTQEEVIAVGHTATATVTHDNAPTVNGNSNEIISEFGVEPQQLSSRTATSSPVASTSKTAMKRQLQGASTSSEVHKVAKKTSQSNVAGTPDEPMAGPSRGQTKARAAAHGVLIRGVKQGNQMAKLRPLNLGNWEDRNNIMAGTSSSNNKKKPSNENTHPPCKMQLRKRLSEKLNYCEVQDEAIFESDEDADSTT